VKKSSLLLGLLLFLAADVHAGKGVDELIVYSGEGRTGPWGKNLAIFEDTSGTMALEQVVALGAFVPSHDPVPNLGVSRSAFWVKASLVNTAVDNPPVLLLDYPEIDEIDLFVVANGKVVYERHAGNLRSLDKALQNSPAFSYPLDIPYAGMVDIYARLQSNKQLQVPLFIQNARLSVTQMLHRNLFMGGYIAIMLVMVLYNLFISISTRERQYFLYSFYLIAVCLAQVSFNGYGAYYLWPGLPEVNAHASLILTVAAMFMAYEFMQRFISLYRFKPGLRWVKRVVYGTSIVAVGMSFLGLAVEAYSVIQAISTSLAAFILYVSISITRKGYRPARYFLAAWSVFVSGVIVFVAKDWGLLPYNELTKYMMTIGSSIEVVLLSFGLADRINVLRKEKDRSQAEALRAAQEKEQLISSQNAELERKVAERTYALQASNDHLKQTQSQLVTAEKMASLGQLTAGIAHEINNPINFISSSIPPLRRDLTELQEVLQAYRQAAEGASAPVDVRALEKQIDVDGTVEEVKDLLVALENGATRTSEIVRGLRTFSRLDEDELKAADINECLRSTLVMLGPQFRDMVEVEYDLADMPMVECLPGKLNQLFLNLLNNAVHAVRKRHGDSGGVVRIGTRLHDGMVEITIADNGIGMDEKVRSRLFEPFFTTKDVGEGTGLGLSIAQGIIDKHQGRIAVNSTPGIGTEFKITFPALIAKQWAKSA